MKLSAFLEKLTQHPEQIEFADTIAAIEANYEFVPTQFLNGSIGNEDNQNNGSCKIFAFGLLNNLSSEQTLACFGTYYRDDVLKHSEGTDHPNIRNFIVSAWEGIKFEGVALNVR